MANHAAREVVKGRTTDRAQAMAEGRRVARPVPGRPTLIKGGRTAEKVRAKKPVKKLPKWVEKIANARGRVGYWLVHQAGAEDDPKNYKSDAFRFHPGESWESQIRMVDGKGNLMSPSAYLRVECDEDGNPTIEAKVIREKDLEVEAELGGEEE